MGRQVPTPESPGRRAVSPEQVIARAGTFTPAVLKYGAALHARLPVETRQLASQPTTAPIVVIALLLAPPRERLQSRQLALVAQRLGPTQARDAAALTERMAGLPHELRLPFVALALPQLAVHPRDYQDALVAALNDLAVADDTVTTPRRHGWQQTLDEGWAALNALDPKAKQALVEAMVMSVLDDGTVTPSEAELLRAACGLIHVPLPALLA